MKTVKEIFKKKSNDFNIRTINNNFDKSENTEKNKEDKNINPPEKEKELDGENEEKIKDENVANEKEKENNEDELLLSYLNSKNKINTEDIKNSSKLVLEEINCNLFNGKKIEINAAGMIGGRNKNDGFTIFGQKKSEDGVNDEDQNDDLNDKNQFIPDFELNYSKFLSYPYIFAIYFKKEEKSFYIKAFSGKGSDNKVLFIKLDNKNGFFVNQKELIFTGNLIFQVTPIQENYIEIINLSNDNFQDKYVIDGLEKKTITIGRHRDCDFSFPNDKSFSRFQTTIEFDEKIKKWSVYDGNKDKGSTNGTWIFGTHSFIIKNEMTAEILNSQIKIVEIKNT